MSTSRKIQIALGAILLWSSTSVSSFAATNTVNPGKNQSVTEKIPVESIPVRSLNLTPDSNLIAQLRGDLVYNTARGMDRDGYIPQWEDALKKPDSKQIILAFCPSQPQDKVDHCWHVLQYWSDAQILLAVESANIDIQKKMRDLRDAVGDAINARFVPSTPPEQAPLQNVIRDLIHRRGL